MCVFAFLTAFHPDIERPFSAHRYLALSACNSGTIGNVEGYQRPKGLEVRNLSILRNSVYSPTSISLIYPEHRARYDPRTIGDRVRESADVLFCREHVQYTNTSLVSCKRRPGWGHVFLSAGGCHSPRPIFALNGQYDVRLTTSLSISYRIRATGLRRKQYSTFRGYLLFGAPRIAAYYRERIDIIIVCEYLIQLFELNLSSQLFSAVTTAALLLMHRRDIARLGVNISVLPCLAGA